MTVLFDAAGRRRSPATLPGYHAGRPPRATRRTRRRRSWRSCAQTMVVEQPGQIADLICEAAGVAALA
jgi:hypothetical protein